MARIRVAGPVVELTGDEMAQVVWSLVRDRLILPHLDLDLVCFDLGLGHRDATGDQVTVQAANAVRRHGVGVKCSTITPDLARARELGLARAWPSPNVTIRDILDGVIVREPILVAGLPRPVPGWVEPIVIARHAHGDQYSGAGLAVPGAGTVSLSFKPADGSAPVQRTLVEMPAGGGVALGMYAVNASIADFARVCFQEGLRRGYPVRLSTKNTIVKTYDGAFVEAFAAVFEAEYRAAFEAAGLTYEHRLVDDMTAAALRSRGGFVWACRNYDGDVQSALVAQGFGSVGLMTSVLVTADGRSVLSEVAHGTVARHFRRYQRGEPTSTNPVATVFAWTGALAHRARLDANPELADFARTLERVCLATVESGRMTRDLARLVGPDQAYLGTEEFLAEVEQNLSAVLA